MNNFLNNTSKKALRDLSPCSNTSIILNREIQKCINKQGTIENNLGNMNVIHSPHKMRLNKMDINKENIESIANEKKIKEINLLPLKGSITKKVANYFHLSKIGYSNEKPKKFNQDDYFIYKGLAEDSATHFFGVW